MAIKRTSKPHDNDRCFTCGKKYSEHTGRCSFEFKAYSTRPDSDIVESFPIKSDSTMKVYAVIKWKQGDYSCNCKGFANYRHCRHIEQVKVAPTTYSYGNNKTATIQEIAEVVNDLRNAGPERTSEIRSKIEYYTQMLTAASEVLSEKETKDIEELRKKLNAQTNVDASDPFANL